MPFQFDYLCGVATYDIIFVVVQHIIDMKQPDLYYFETIKMTSQT